MATDEEYVIENDYPNPDLPTDASFSDYFLRRIAIYGNHIAMIDPESGAMITYAALSIRVERMRTALYRIGVTHGDVIGTYTGNSADFIIFCLAATSIGAIVTPINPAYKTYEVEKYFCEANVKWAITEARYFEKLSKGVLLQGVQELDTLEKAKELKVFLQDVNTLQATIVLDSAQTTFVSFGFQSFLSDQIERSTVERAVIGQDPALIFFSSGTTGPPKGVILSNRSLIATIEIVRIAQCTKSAGFQMVVLNGNDIVYGVLPYFHAGGLLTVYCMLVQGVKLVINEKFDGAKFLDTIERYKVTTLNLVPPILDFLVNSPLVQMPRLSTLKHIFVGAARTESNLLQKVKEKLRVANIIELYGMTEAGAMIFMHPGECEIRPGSCGIPLPGVQCKVLDIQDKTVCGPLQSGEICVRTSTMMSAYLRESEQNSAFTPDGWFQTGDIGYYDDDKFFYITGRTKEMIKVRGWQVSPYEIEEVICHMNEVEQCVVIGVPDEQAGQLPRAYIKLKEGAHLYEDDIQKLITEKLSSYKQLNGGIEFIDQLPMTASGKIARSQLLSDFMLRSNK